MNGCIKTLEQFMRCYADSLHDQWDALTDDKRKKYHTFVDFCAGHYDQYQKSVEDSL